MASEYTMIDLSHGRSTASRVCETLRQMILTNELKPGERLVEAKIAKALNVSITPVRQAFALLSSQGLLSVFPYRGTYTTILTREYAYDLTTVRKSLEVTAANQAFEHFQPGDIHYLEELCRLSDASNQAGDCLTSIQYDVIFHEFFFRKSGNSLINEMWDMIKNRIVFFQYTTRPNCQAVTPLLVDRHREIINAVSEMNRDKLAKSIAHHLDISLEHAMLPSDADVVYK